MKKLLNLNDIIEWDIENWSIALQYWEKNTSYDFSSISALEIGCHHGGLSLWAALHGAKVLCTDLDGPSGEAIEKHKKYNVTDLIKYQALNALDIPYCENFDVVFFKSVLGSLGACININNQINAINEIHKSLKKGGELWFAENLAASFVHQYFRRRYVEWGSKWRYITIQEMKDMLTVFSDVKYTTVGFLGAFGRNACQRSVLGKVDRILVKRLVPEAWRYIIIGIAKK